MHSCSVVIPIHNEGKNIEGFISRFWHDLGDLRDRVVEIILVENGSSDGSYEVCQRIKSQYPGLIELVKISLPSYGEAIKKGVSQALAEIIVILECDAMDVEFMRSALSILDREQADFIVASKRHPQSVDLRPLKRRLLTLLFNAWLRMYFDFPGTDTHGLKAIRSDVAKALVGLSITGDEVFQTEIVLLAHKIGYRVEEVPIRLEEKRAPGISIRRRFSKVVRVIKELKRSLSRFK